LQLDFEERALLVVEMTLIVLAELVELVEYYLLRLE
jgi:hypothetical protein